MSITYEIIKSWNHTAGTVNSMDEIMRWIQEKNADVKVNVEKVDFSYHGFWYYDEQDGYIRNLNNSFFQLAGYQEIEDDRIIGEQPIIIQNEIGYLGILCKVIDGTLNFLMQAKIEPGNINVVQLSPTIQAISWENTVEISPPIWIILSIRKNIRYWQTSSNRNRHPDFTRRETVI